jgi:hypothetical protein
MKTYASGDILGYIKYTADSLLSSLISDFIGIIIFRVTVPINHLINNTSHKLTLDQLYLPRNQTNLLFQYNIHQNQKYHLKK